MRATLRWWLWTSCTGVALFVAGIFGFYGALLKNDITYLGFAVLALYALSTGWLALKVRAGNVSYDFIWYIAETMERVGLLGTFIGLAVAFQALGDMAAGGVIGADWKRTLIEGIMTKFYASIVGLVGAMMLKTQIKILDAGHEA